MYTSSPLCDVCNEPMSSSFHPWCISASPPFEGMPPLFPGRPQWVVDPFAFLTGLSHKYKGEIPPHVTVEPHWREARSFYSHANVLKIVEGAAGQVDLDEYSAPLIQFYTKDHAGERFTFPQHVANYRSVGWYLCPTGRGAPPSKPTTYEELVEGVCHHL